MHRNPVKRGLVTGTRKLDMEQLQGARLRRRGLGKGQLSRMALDHQLFRLAIPLIRKPRMSGAPGKDNLARAHVN